MLDPIRGHSEGQGRIGRDESPGLPDRVDARDGYRDGRGPRVDETREEHILLAQPGDGIGIRAPGNLAGRPRGGNVDLGRQGP